MVLATATATATTTATATATSTATATLQGCLDQREPMIREAKDRSTLSA